MNEDLDGCVTVVDDCGAFAITVVVSRSDRVCCPDYMCVFA